MAHPGPPIHIPTPTPTPPHPQYIAKRLMTDDSPRLQAALRYMVYGRDTVFDADRLIGAPRPGEGGRPAGLLPADWGVLRR